MHKKQLYLIGVFYNIFLMLLFTSFFIYLIIIGDQLRGLNNYIYWLIYHVLLIFISIFQYKAPKLYPSTSFKMSLLYFVPQIFFIFYILYSLNDLNIPYLNFFIVYDILFILNGILYLYAMRLNK